MPDILESVDEYLTPRMRNLLALLWNAGEHLEQQVLDIQLAISSDCC
jgi:transposase